jgi:hypothetical protein
MQTGAVILIVAAAAVLIGRRIIHSAMKTKSGCGCGCTGCSDHGMK